jgi:hypothetical protein
MGDISIGGFIIFPMMRKREIIRERVKHMNSNKDCSYKVYLQGESLLSIKREEELGKKHEEKNM